MERILPTQIQIIIYSNRNILSLKEYSIKDFFQKAIFKNIFFQKYSLSQDFFRGTKSQNSNKKVQKTNSKIFFPSSCIIPKITISQINLNSQFQLHADYLSQDFFLSKYYLPKEQNTFKKIQFSISYIFYISNYGFCMSKQSNFKISNVFTVRQQR